MSIPVIENNSLFYANPPSIEPGAQTAVLAFHLSSHRGKAADRCASSHTAAKTSLGGAMRHPHYSTSGFAVKIQLARISHQFFGTGLEGVESLDSDLVVKALGGKTA